MKKYNDMKRKVFIAVMSLVVSGGLSGQSVYPGQHSGKLKKETIAPMQVKSFDLSFVGTICITLSNGTVTYVSRRSVAKIKQLLGM